MTIIFDRFIEQKDRAQVNLIKQAFGAERLHDGDFAFYLADLFVSPVQYGNRTQLCEFLETLADVAPMDRYKKLAEFTKGSHSLDSYDRQALKNETIVVAKSSRQWTYQYCTEFGYFQTPYRSLHMRSSLLKYDFWVDYCKAIFGSQIVTRAKETNQEYGSVNLVTTNTFFVNGGEDPWQWAGVSQTSLNNISRLLQCENCAHCVDLYTAKPSDSELLTKTRVQIQKWLRLVLYGFFEN